MYRVLCQYVWLSSVDIFNLNNMKQFFLNIHNKLLNSTWVTSPKHSRFVIGVAFLLIAALIFQAGIVVGYHKATFGDRMGKAYYRAFDKDFSHMKGKGEKKMRQGAMDRIPAGFGAAGKIVQVNLPTIVMVGPDNIERYVEITNDTLIKQFNDNVASTSLKIDQHAVVIGEPNTDGVIVAKLIRLLPAPPMDITKENMR